MNASAVLVFLNDTKLNVELVSSKSQRAAVATLLELLEVLELLELVTVLEDRLELVNVLLEDRLELVTVLLEDRLELVIVLDELVEEALLPPQATPLNVKLVGTWLPGLFTRKPILTLPPEARLPL